MTTATAEAKVVKWGNSHGVRIPRNIIDASGLSIGDEVQIAADEGAIIITPLAPRPRYKRAGHRSIEEIFGDYAGPILGEEWLVGRIGAEALDD